MRVKRWTREGEILGLEEPGGKWDFRGGSAGRGNTAGPGAAGVGACVCVCGACACAPPRGCHSQAPYLGQLRSKSHCGGSGSAGPDTRAADGGGVSERSGGGMATPRFHPPIGFSRLSEQPNQPIGATDITVILILLIIINPTYTSPTERFHVGCGSDGWGRCALRCPQRPNQPTPRTAGGAVRLSSTRRHREDAEGGGETPAPVSRQLPLCCRGKMLCTGRGTLICKVS